MIGEMQIIHHHHRVGARICCFKTQDEAIGQLHAQLAMGQFESEIERLTRRKGQIPQHVAAVVLRHGDVAGVSGHHEIP